MMTFESPKIDDNDRETHPAYAVVEISRCDGTHGPLFGSSLPEHHGYIEFRLNRAVMLGQAEDRRVFGPRAGHIVSFKFSYAQFVDIMSSMNRGGVPCTLSRLTGHDGVTRMVPQIRYEKGETRSPVDDVVNKMNQKANELARGIEAIRKEVIALLGEAKLTKKLRQEIAGHLARLDREISELPFYIRLAEEAGEKTVNAMRIEAEAAVTNAIRNIGIEVLAKKMDEKVLEENHQFAGLFDTVETIGAEDDETSHG